MSQQKAAKIIEKFMEREGKVYRKGYQDGF